MTRNKYDVPPAKQIAEVLLLNPGLTAVDVNDVLKLPLGTVTSQLSIMHKNGAVSAYADPERGRIYCVSDLKALPPEKRPDWAGELPPLPEHLEEVPVVPHLVRPGSTPRKSKVPKLDGKLAAIASEFGRTLERTLQQPVSAEPVWKRPAPPAEPTPAEPTPAAVSLTLSINGQNISVSLSDARRIWEQLRQIF